MSKGNSVGFTAAFCIHKDAKQRYEKNVKLDGLPLILHTCLFVGCYMFMCRELICHGEWLCGGIMSHYLFWEVDMIVL